MARFSWRDPAHGGGVYWTDGWDGYAAGAQAPARHGRGERRCPASSSSAATCTRNYVADLKADYDDAAAPVVASEFCGTSITSLALAQARVDAARAVQPAHPLRAAPTSAATCSFELDAKQLRAALQVVDRPVDPDSGITTAARFVVEAARPGAHPG